MNYEAAQQIRAMAEVIARRLGHTYRADMLCNFDDCYSYADGVVTIYDKCEWLEIRAPNADGLLVQALTIGGLSCKGNDAALLGALDHIRALYIAAHFCKPLEPETIRPCQN